MADVTVTAVSQNAIVMPKRALLSARARAKPVAATVDAARKGDIMVIASGETKENTHLSAINTATHAIYRTDRSPSMRKRYPSAAPTQEKTEPDGGAALAHAMPNGAAEAIIEAPLMIKPMAAEAIFSTTRVDF